MALPSSLPVQEGDSGLDIELCFLLAFSASGLFQPVELVGLQRIFQHPLRRHENLSVIWPNLRHSLLPATAWWVFFEAFLRPTETTPKFPSNHFLVLRLCHKLNVENQARHVLRSFQGKHPSPRFLGSGDIYPVLRSQPLLDLTPWEMSIFIFTLFSLPE